MFMSKIPLLKSTVGCIQYKSGQTSVLAQKFLHNTSSFSTSVRLNEQQDTTKDHLLTLSTEQSGNTPDKLYKKIEIEVRGNEPAVLKSYGEYAVMAAKYLEIKVARNTAPFKPVNQRWTVLKSAHVHKKHRVQYEFRTYYRYLDFLQLTGSTADTFLEYLERNLPEGVAMKVTKTELKKLPESITAMSKS